MVLGYGAVQWAGPALSLIFTPIITRVLSPADYGTTDYLLTIASALATLALLGIPQAVITHYNDREGDLSWQHSIAGSAVLIVTASGMIVGSVLFVSADALSTYVPFLVTYTLEIRIVAVGLLFSTIATTLTTTAQSALRVRWGMVFSIVTIIVTILGNVIFVLIYRLGVTGMILTSFSSNMALWATTIILMHTMLGRPTTNVSRLLLRSGLVLLPTMGAAWVLQVSDRLFLGQTVSASELGYYSIANRMASLVGIMMSPIYAAWTPLALAVQSEQGALQRYVSISRYLFAVVLMGSLGIGLFSTEILIILTRPAYLPASPYVGFLTFIYVFGGLSAILNTGAVMGKQLGAITSAVVIGAAGNLLLNWLLIPRFGLWGATIATIIGFGIPVGILFVILQHRYPIPYPAVSFAAAIVLQFGLLILGLSIPSVAFLIRLLEKTVIFAFLPIGLILLRIVKPSEFVTLWLFLRGRIDRRTTSG